MIAKWITGETRPVIRRRRGVLWCPFCDRSRQETINEAMHCAGCNAQFSEDTSDPIGEPPTRRRRRANDDSAESDEE